MSYVSVSRTGAPRPVGVPLSILEKMIAEWEAAGETVVVDAPSYIRACKAEGVKPSRRVKATSKTAKAAPKAEKSNGNGGTPAADCPRCAGAGVLSQYAHRNGGECYLCKGTGKRAAKGSTARLPHGGTRVYGYIHANGKVVWCKSAASRDAAAAAYAKKTNYTPVKVRVG